MPKHGEEEEKQYDDDVVHPEKRCIGSDSSYGVVEIQREAYSLNLDHVLPLSSRGEA